MASDVNIPLIDLSDLGTSDDSDNRLAAAVRAACPGHGFFMVSQHGLDEGLMADVFAASRRFHDLPLEDKNAIKLNHWHRGYQGFATSKLVSSARFAPAVAANQLSSFFLRQEVSPDHPDYMRAALKGPNQWPDDPDFREVVSRYDTAVRHLAHRLLPLFALAVGEPPDFFGPYFNDATTALRLIHYPPSEAPSDGGLGIQPHTDYGFITILAQDDIGGLEIQLPEGRWMPIPPLPGTLIINIGDALARWTNDTFNSTPHRVISPKVTTARYSVALFFDPDMDTTIRCLDQFTTPAKPPRHPAIRYGDYIEKRLNSNYPDPVGETGVEAAKG